MINIHRTPVVIHVAISVTGQSLTFTDIQTSVSMPEGQCASVSFLCIKIFHDPDSSYMDFMPENNYGCQDVSGNRPVYSRYEVVLFYKK